MLDWWQSVEDFRLYPSNPWRIPMSLSIRYMVPIRWSCPLLLRPPTRMFWVSVSSYIIIKKREIRTVLLISCSWPSNLPSQKDKQLRSPRQYEFCLPPRRRMVRGNNIVSAILRGGMSKNTSRGHLPLHHHYWEFGVFEVRNPAMKRQSKRLSTKCSDSRFSHPIPALLRRHRLTRLGVDIYSRDELKDTSSLLHHDARLRKSAVKLQNFWDIKKRNARKVTKQLKICLFRYENCQKKATICKQKHSTW